MLMKKKILLMMLLAAVLPLTALPQSKTLVVHHADGTTTDVELYTMPRVIFGDDKVYVRSAVANLEFDKDDVLRFTYKNVGETGVNNVQSDRVFRIEGDCIVFYGEQESVPICVYNASGQQLPVRLSADGNHATLPLDQLKRGVYLISINGKTFKFIRP